MSWKFPESQEAWDKYAAKEREHLSFDMRSLLYEACGQSHCIPPSGSSYPPGDVTTPFDMGPHVATFWRKNTKKYVYLNEKLHDENALLAWGVPIDLMAYEVPDHLLKCLHWWQISEYPPGFHVCKMTHGVVVPKPSHYPEYTDPPKEVRYDCSCGLKLKLNLQLVA